jgi:hypothetical protein
LLKFGLHIFVGHRSLAFVTIEHGRTGLAKESSLLSFLIVAANALPEVNAALISADTDIMERSSD